MVCCLNYMTFREQGILASPPREYELPALSEIGVLRSICRDSFFEFLKEFWPTIIAEDPIWNWHIEYLCNEIQKVAERVFQGLPKLYDLVINISPGSTKSTIISQVFPAWTWSRMPSARHICASYAYQLALKDSIRCRDIVESALYQACFPNIHLREDENMKGLFVNTLKGSRLSVGVRGQVTGYHGHFLAVDDPLNPEEAFSEAELAKANRWMETTLPSRAIDKAITPLILVQQRLHQGDPSGEMLAKGGDVKHICLPAELTDAVAPPELREFYRDGLFDPIRLPRSVLEEMRRKLGEYGYASQFLQDPVPLGGGMFKIDCFKLEKESPRQMVKLIRSWDKAGTKGGGAYSCGVLMGIDKIGDPWIIDVIRGQWAAAEREKIIKRTAEMDASGIYVRTTKEEDAETYVEILLEIEGGSGGKESAENTIRNLAGFHVTAVHPTGDKEARAYAFASQVGVQDHVHVLERHWTRAYLEELRFFPRSKYKDQVDASAAAYNRIARRKRRIGGLKLAA